MREPDTSAPSFTVEDIEASIREGWPDPQEEGWTIEELCERRGVLPLERNKRRMRSRIRDLEVLGKVECIGQRPISRPPRRTYWVDCYRAIK